MSSRTDSDRRPGMPAEPHSVLIIGCGYLGLRAARAWRLAGCRVLATTRGRVQELNTLGVVPIRTDILDPRNFATLPQVDTILFAVGIDRSTGHSLRDVYVDGLQNVLEHLNQQGTMPRRFLYVSSTSVYGQTHGGDVYETDVTSPLESSGFVILEAERLLRSYDRHSIILRFAGIYGPGRLLRQRQILAGAPLIGDAEKWLNLIHVEDGARAILAAESRAQPGAVYNITDDSPVRRRDFYTCLAEQLHAPPAQFEPYPDGTTVPLEANRRIRGTKARTELGFVPVFADYTAGIAASVEE
ncbi:MAG: SDR family oxidoreductase [Bacteroidales bacterium]|nr:SDR family oxidoreductase [Bacteroidales bacterium]